MVDVSLIISISEIRVFQYNLSSFVEEQSGQGSDRTNKYEQVKNNKSNDEVIVNNKMRSGVFLRTSTAH